MGAESTPKMQYRFLGRSGLQVSVISLGGWLTYGGHVENRMQSSLYIYEAPEGQPSLTKSRENFRLHESRL